MWVVGILSFPGGKCKSWEPWAPLLPAHTVIPRAEEAAQRGCVLAAQLRPLGKRSSVLETQECRHGLQSSAGSKHFSQGPISHVFWCRSSAICAFWINFQQLWIPCHGRLHQDVEFCAGIKLIGIYHVKWTELVIKDRLLILTYSLRLGIQSELWDSYGVSGKCVDQDSWDEFSPCL